MAISIPIIAEFTGNGIERAKKEFAQLEGAGKKAQYAIKKAAIPAAAALAGVGAALFDATKSAVEDAAAQTILATNIKNATNATDAQIKSVENAITSFSQQAAVTDDELRPAFGKLVTATKDVQRSQKLMQIALDASAATGKPLETVVNALTKAEMGQYAALKKLGIPISDGIQSAIDLAKEQKKLIKIEQDLASVRDAIATKSITGADATKKLSAATEKFAAQQEIVNGLLASTGDYADDVAKAFSGAASDSANTAAGQFKKLSISIAETKESIGAALLPAVQMALPYLTKFGEWAQKNPTLFLAVAGGIAAMAAAIVAVNIAMSLNPIALIAAGIAALVIGLAVAYKRFEGFRNIVDAVFSGISWYIHNVTIPAVMALVSVFKAAFNGIASVWNNTVGKLSFKVPSWVPGIGGKGFDIPNIPMLAAGGIVNSPTLAMIGEAGPEAVIPLDRMGEMGGGNNVTIHVNGGDPNAVVDALRRYMRQNGSVPIKISNAY